MSEPTNMDVLDAVTLELSRFTRDVVDEMHRLRDELIAERQRTDQLEAMVQSLQASLRKYDTQAAGIVDHVTRRSDAVDRRLDSIEGLANGRPTPLALDVRQTPLDASADGAPTQPEPEAEPSALSDDGICFAPLTLTLDPVEVRGAQDPSIGDLVARVVGAIVPPVEPPHDGTVVLDLAPSGQT